jgi:hypothetical protein
MPPSVDRDADTTPGAGHGSRAFRSFVLTAVVVAAPASTKGAGMADEILRLAYHADSGCPSGAEFVAQIGVDETRVELASSGWPRADITVTLTVGPDGSLGRLEFGAPNEAATVREVSGNSCRSVADALALAATLAVDSRRMPPKQPDRVPSRPQRAAEPVDTVRDDSRLARSPWQWGSGLSGGLVTGPLVKLTPRAAFLVDLSLAAPAMSFRAYATHVFSRTRLYGWGSATAELTAAGLELCPLSVISAPLRVRACVAGELGALAVSGEPNAPDARAQSTRALWAAVLGSGRAEWVLGSHLQAELQGGALVPLTRHEYALVEPDTQVGEVPAIGAAASLGLLARFP